MVSNSYRLWFCDSNHAIATFDHIMLQVWRGRQTLRNYRAEGSVVHQQLVAAHPHGVATLVITEPTCGPITAQDRRDAIQEWRTHGHHAFGHAVVVMGNGARSHLVRTVVTAMTLLANSDRPIRVFDAVIPATTWLEGRGRWYRKRLDLATLEQRLAELRSTMRLPGQPREQAG